MNKFKHNAITLIELVENRPCLWDKSCSAYKNRLAKEKAWDEVYSCLDNSFQTMKKKDKLNMSKLIQAKWQNLRDSFVKSLKKKPCQLGSTKKYIYSDNFQFLLKVLDKDENESRLSESESETKKVSRLKEAEMEENSTEDDEYDILRVTPICQYQEKSTVDPPDDVGNKKSRFRQEELDRKILFELQNAKPDADEAFFISIIPAVRNMSEDEKLEFKIGVLSLIKDIKKQACTIQSPSNLSGFSSDECSLSNAQAAVQYSSYNGIAPLEPR